MRWPWSKPKRPEIPPYRVPEPVVLPAELPKKDDGLKVEEHDTSAMTQTGVHKAWKRLSGD
jgi:hypothetical protein